MMNAYHERVVGIPWQNIKTIYIDFSWYYENHWHLEYEIIYIKRGRQRVYLEGELIDLQEGDFLIVAPGQVHSYLDEMGKSEVMIIVMEQSILKSLGLSSSEYAQFAGFFSMTRLARFTYSQPLKDSFDALCLKIHLERESEDLGYMISLHAYVYQIIISLYRNVKFEVIEKRENSIFKKEFDKLIPVFNYVEENYMHPITLDDVVKQVHFNKYYFCKLFKKVTDSTFVNYLNGFRVLKAEWELINSDKSISRICMEVGFESMDSFAKAFRSFKDCTPSSYRKNWNKTIQ